MSKKAQMPMINAPLSIVIIIVLLIMFTTYFNFMVKSPINIIEKADRINVGNIFIINYIQYPVIIDSNTLSIAQALLMIKYEKDTSLIPKYRKAILDVTRPIMSSIYEYTDKSPCFSLYLDGIEILKETNSCTEVGLRGEISIPNKDKVLNVLIEGK